MMSSSAPTPTPPSEVVRGKFKIGRGAVFGAACIAMQPVLLSMVALPATAYVIRRLGATEYGQWMTATTIVSTVTFLTNLGLRGTFVRTVARHPEGAAEALADQLGIRITLSLLASVLGLSACLLLDYSRVVITCTAISCAGLVMASIFTTASDLLQGFHRFPTVAAVNMAAGLMLTAGSVSVVYFGGGPIGTAISYLIGPVISIVLFTIIVGRQHFPVRVRWNFSRFRVLLWQARFIGVQQLVSSANQNAEALLIPRMLGATQFGFFAAGTLLSTRLTAIPDGIGTAAYPIIARKHVISGRAAVISTMYFLGLVMVPCLVAAIGGTLLAGPVANLLFPGRAEVCESVMRITVWLLPLMGLQCVLSYALNAVHADAAQAKASVTGAILSVFIAVILVWRFGLVGASWSMVARYGMQLIVLTPCIYRTTKQLWNERPVEVSPANGVISVNAAVAAS